ncbi:MAG: helix-turn-helix transcriptional regulator [Thermodesulfobacteriota bacterium]|nr:helix-turn-helix transcriptional regulator [Thermodesulfobacteriota bacterium]
MGRTQTFGKLIKELRLKNTPYSLRKFAEVVGISPPYLSRLEAERDPPPSAEIIVKMAEALGVDKDQLLSCADKVSPDVLNIIKENPSSVPSFLRLAGERRLSEKDWKRINQFVQSENLGKGPR